ncbi:hypothetical protein SAMN04489760_105168 [Syntrophus gentianae]|uniref:Uncharacterized protein n=1 Tax=Syntrophus gentianae TaxID=43775 RepID=A0A1H7W5U7_9BACT|nr:hypothetical protein SAMN04489760_105168 [Syntrophus gentianae]
MLIEQLDAATAAFHVGCESPSPFGRKNNRWFGAPSLRDVNALRQMAGSTTVYKAGRFTRQILWRLDCKEKMGSQFQSPPAC